MGYMLMRSTGKASCTVLFLSMVFLDLREIVRLRILENGLAFQVDCLNRCYIPTANDLLMGL